MTDPVAEPAWKSGASPFTSSAKSAVRDGSRTEWSSSCTKSDAQRASTRTIANLTASLRDTHEVCERHNDVATASLIEVWIDETERRAWFLGEIIDSVD